MLRWNRLQRFQRDDPSPRYQRAEHMTAVMSPPEPPIRAESLQPPPPLADASMLEDKVPEGLKASRVLAGFSVFIGLLFLFLSFRPLWHTDLWGVWPHVGDDSQFACDRTADAAGVGGPFC